MVSADCPPTMSLDLRNTNTVWSSVLVETLVQLGLELAVICPGSRSAPLAIALVQHPQLETLTLLDERSAAFFALGHARRRHRPVLLVCTSGTAGANFYPAVIEARESGVPLIVITADRPAELRHCHAGQTIDQLKLFGTYPSWQAELPHPDASLSLLASLRQSVVRAWERSQYPQPGPVHLNQPLREPLAPHPEAELSDFSLPETFCRVAPSQQPRASLVAPPIWSQQPRGLIVVGLTQPSDPEAFTMAVRELARHYGWPILADALNPLRHRLGHEPWLICGYDLILRSPAQAAGLAPEVVVQIGELPTSKQLRQCLSEWDCPRWIVAPGSEDWDPLQGQPQRLSVAVTDLVPGPAASPDPDWEDLWEAAEQRAQSLISHNLEAALAEPNLYRPLADWLPVGTPIFVSNSTPIRDTEWFWQPSQRHYDWYFNRGANGIDGITSTAMGMAWGDRPSLLITGDLAFLHDTNALLLAHRFRGSLTVLLIDNGGGGIFELLPVRQCDDVPFEECFGTPQHVDWPQLLSSYGVRYQSPESLDDLQAALRHLPAAGVQVLHIRCDRRRAAAGRQALFIAAAQA